MELLSKLVVLFIEMMSADRAIVRFPPFTGVPFELVDPVLAALQPPSANAAVTAIATTAPNLFFIECLTTLCILWMR
jgi:hypothetical protein